MLVDFGLRKSAIIDRIKQRARFKALYFCEGRRTPAAVAELPKVVVIAVGGLPGVGLLRAWDLSHANSSVTTRHGSTPVSF